MATSFHKNLECPVCLRFFKDPKILACSHTFCKRCLGPLLDLSRNKDVLLCPTCRGETSIPGGDVGRLQSNITVRSLVEDVETQGQLEDLLSRLGPNDELPRKTAEEGERLCLRSQVSDGLDLGQLIRQKKSKWVLRTEDLLPVGCLVKGMAISPNNEMAVGYYIGGIFIYSAEGIIQDTVLKSVKVEALHFMPDTGYVIRENNNNVFLYTDLSAKLDVTFETMADAGSVFCSLTVGKDGLIFIGSDACKKIQVFKPEGGKAIREIKCNRFEPWQMFAMTSSQAIVVKNGVTKVDVIDDVSGAIIHSISKDDEFAYPAVCQDNSVIIAWVKKDQGLLSIVQYTHELKYIKNILTDFKITKGTHFRCCLQEFKTGEIAFCTHDMLYIFHETWE